MNDDHTKDEIIVALQETVQEWMSKCINMRVATGLKIKELEAKVAELTKDLSENGKSAMKPEDFSRLEKH